MKLSFLFSCSSDKIQSPIESIITAMLLFALILLILSVQSLKIHDIDLSFYHNSSQIQKIVQGFLQLSPAKVTKLECKQNYSFLSISSENKTKSLSAILTCNIHARQLFTSELCLKFIEELLKNQTKSAQKLNKYLNLIVFYEGNEMRDKALDEQHCRRTDSNCTLSFSIDVDINRNFPTGFLGEEKGQQTNPGPQPLSEPFSQCVEQQIKIKKPDIFLDIHTGEFSIYHVDFDSKTEHTTSDEVFDEPERTVIANVNKVCKNCRVRRDENQGVMYVDIKIRQNVKWANLFQVYGGYDANLGQDELCLKIFNPTSRAFFDFYIKRGKKMMFAYFQSIIDIQLKV